MRHPSLRRRRVMCAVRGHVFASCDATHASVTIRCVHCGHHLAVIVRNSPPPAYVEVDCHDVCEELWSLPARGES